MPYYPPSSGGGTGPGETPTISQVLDQGNEAATDQLLSFKSSTTAGARSGSTLNAKALAVAHFQDEAEKESLGIMTNPGLPGVDTCLAWINSASGAMVLVTIGETTGLAQVAMPSTSGTLALLSDIPAGGGETPNISQVLAAGNRVTGATENLPVLAVDSPGNGYTTTTSLVAGGFSVAKIEDEHGLASAATLNSEILTLVTRGGKSYGVSAESSDEVEVSVVLPATSGTLALQSEVAAVDALVENLETALAAAVAVNGTLSSDVATLKSDYAALLLRVEALEGA